jgi:hypothetical protein
VILLSVEEAAFYAVLDPRTTAGGDAMYENHQGRAASKAQSGAGQQLMAEIDEACLILASEVAHGLHKLGFDKAADWLTPLGGPVGPHANAAH